jgi:sec-independent protein translocase protein TatB
MLDLSFLEMMVVFVVGLLVLGPERLPKVARQIGWWIGRIRTGLYNMRVELERESSVREFRAATKDIEQSIGNTTRDIEQSISETAQETRTSVESAAADRSSSADRQPPQ